MKCTETRLTGVYLIEPGVFSDDRGFFMETYHGERYSKEGIDSVFVQDNRSHSRKGTLRGLHYQLLHGQDKLIYAVTGEIFDVAVDIRRGSPTFGHWVGDFLSAENRRQIFVPKGFAHGFCVISEVADVIYKCSDFYAPDDEYGIFWDDPAVGIEWPLKDVLLSPKDRRNPELSQVKEELLPRYVSESGS
jgi:dTDP-4-dehydrorhamnose 3,5-epimerase